MCNFFNATLYADYKGCNIPLSKGVTYGILRNEDTIRVDTPNGTAPWYGNGTHGYGKGKRSGGATLRLRGQ